MQRAGASGCTGRVQQPYHDVDGSDLELAVPRSSYYIVALSMDCCKVVSVSTKFLNHMDASAFVSNLMQFSLQLQCSYIQIPKSIAFFSTCSAMFHILRLFLIDPLSKHLLKYAQPNTATSFLLDNSSSGTKYQGVFVVIQVRANASLSDSKPTSLNRSRREVQRRNKRAGSGSCEAI